MTQGKIERIQEYYESWDTEFGKVYNFCNQPLLMVGEVSFLWSGLIAKSELHQLVDELFEEALLRGRTDPQECFHIIEEAYY
jgi:hypothetical protein